MKRPAQQITSRSNRWFRRFRDAIESHEDEIVLEGRKAIADAVALGWTPSALAASEPTTEESIVFAPSLFRELTGTVHPQGILALFPRPTGDVDSLFESGGIIVVLDGVQDPGNVGAIIRLAAAFDVAGVVTTEGTADPWSPKVIRATAGTILTVPVCAGDPAAILEAAAGHDFEICAAMRPANHQSPSEVPHRRALMIFGSEGRGVSQFFRHARPLWIPISDRVESLNVAAAAAILLQRSHAARK